MSKRKVSLVICCEDKQQECFARIKIKNNPSMNFDEKLKIKD